MLVIDEAHTFFAEVKGDKELMALAAENRRSVEELVKKGLSVGIVTLLAPRSPPETRSRRRVRVHAPLEASTKRSICSTPEGVSESSSSPPARVRPKNSRRS